MFDPLAPLTAENKLNDLNKKITEIKKKIQLSEGQRKANFEEFDAKKHENAQKIHNLRQNVKELYTEYASTKNIDEKVASAGSVVRGVSATIKNRGLNEEVNRAKETNMRLRKKLDLLKYQREKKSRHMESLMKEYSQLTSGKIEKKFKRRIDKPTKHKIVRLEVRLEHIRMMQIKANIIRMKYRSMRSELKEKSVLYASSLKNLENDIKEQESEMKRLQGVNEEAIELRDNTQETLIKEEIEITNSSKERDAVLQEYRQRVLERKLELERLERMIFQSRPRDDFDTRGKSQIQATEDITKDEVTRLEEAFAKLRSATGVSRTEDVLNRFLGQRATKNNLQKMRAATEQEKMDLEKHRQELLAEMETRKFSESKNAEQNAEVVEKLNKEIKEEEERQERAECEYRRINILLNNITECFWQLCDKLRDTTDLPSKDQGDSNSPTDLIQLINEKISDIIEAFDSPNKYFEFMDEVLADKVETISITTGSTGGKVLRTSEGSLFPRFPTSSMQATVPSEEEEDVPNRNTLKKQAQQIVDAKSRRKGFGFKR